MPLKLFFFNHIFLGFDFGASSVYGVNVVIGTCLDETTRIAGVIGPMRIERLDAYLD